MTLNNNLKGTYDSIYSSVEIGAYMSHMPYIVELFIRCVIYKFHYVLVLLSNKFSYNKIILLKNGDLLNCLPMIF